MRRWIVVSFILGMLLLPLSGTAISAEEEANPMPDRVTHTEEEWREILTPVEFYVLREKGTERAFSGAYWDNHEEGEYHCAGCGQLLFRSTEKYDSGTGWPSFWAPAAEENLQTEKDRKFFMVRTEVLCSRCGGHLGHVFEDGPPPTGLRYCINSAALRFIPAGDEDL